MKFMTKLETLIMNRTGCNRETANLVANDILQEVEKDISTEVAREIFGKIDRIRALERCLYKRGLEGIYDFNNEYTELKKQYDLEELK